MKRHSIILLLLLPLIAQAQTVRDITISADQPYTDNVTLARESGDMDVMIKFSFDEANNKVVVAMTSYRGLFVFRDDVRYRQVVHCGKLNVKAMPYVVSSDPVSFKMPSKFRHQLGKDLKNFVFKRWINYDGLQPEPAEYKMVNDVISQTFLVVGADRTRASVTIGDVMIMEPKLNCAKQPYYVFLYYGHVNTRYNITIKRDPCFGKEEQTQIATQQAEAVAQAFDGLKKIFPGRVTNQKEVYELFQKTRDVLLTQYTKRDTVSPCKTIQDANDRYNLMVDSLFAMKCRYQPSDSGEQSIANAANPSYILSRAYQLDIKTSRWLLTEDPVEKTDIVSTCEAMIGDVKTYVKTVKSRSPEMLEAIRVFQKAEEYFKSKCHVK